MIPVSEPAFGEPEIAAVMDCLRSGWISSHGAHLDAFESQWAAYCGRRHGVSVVNGTAALELAVAALRLEPGSEIIMPSFTIVSCVFAALRTGAVPKLVDADPLTWTMDIDAVRAAIGPRTRAIMPVHIYGHPVDMDPILELGAEHELRIVEDAAEAHGAEYKGRRCGSFGDVSCFSFYANKLITTGEGGMLVTDDDTIAERARLLRNLAFDPARRFHHAEMGFNFRMTNVQAALGLPQIARMDAIIAKKRWIGGEYTRRLADLSSMHLPVEKSWARSVYWMYGVVLDERVGFDANEVARRLAALGVETRPFFLGMHEQEVFRRQGLFAGESYPVAERIARRGLYLPSGLTLTPVQLERVVDAVREVLP
ncbi:MAG TPA: DegT/DnrJ/EryC1/StrS family aminotransferase [Gemmatimonadaceae bacterium]|jgi:perosamine synthetase|nr:DegT/DnrJ/EryC1/StrS family aminotransferase [Gemmatimonadaceae bacterium]